LIDNVNFRVTNYKNRLAISFWTFFKYFGNHSELEKTGITKQFCWCWGILLK